MSDKKPEQPVNTAPSIEVCANRYFIRYHIIYDECFLQEPSKDTLAATRWVDKFINQLDVYGIDWKLAKGQRSQYHGWYGARFKTRGIGWGSFDDVPDVVREDIDRMALWAAERCR